MSLSSHHRLILFHFGFSKFLRERVLLRHNRILTGYTWSEPKWKLRARVSAVKKNQNAPNTLWAKLLLSCQNVFYSAAAWEYWNIIRVAAMSRLVSQRRNAVVVFFCNNSCLQSCLVSKNLFLYPEEHPCIYTRMLLQTTARRLKKRAWAALGNNLLIVKRTWNKLTRRLSGSVL